MFDLSNMNKENLVSTDDPLGTIAFISMNDFLSVTLLECKFFEAIVNISCFGLDLIEKL